MSYTMTPSRAAHIKKQRFHFPATRFCEACREARPIIGGHQLPGKIPTRKGPWICATCKERRDATVA